MAMTCSIIYNMLCHSHKAQNLFVQLYVSVMAFMEKRFKMKFSVDSFKKKRENYYDSMLYLYLRHGQQIEISY